MSDMSARARTPMATNSWFVTAAVLTLFACATGTQGAADAGPANDTDADLISALPDASLEPVDNGCEKATCDLLPQCGCGQSQACDLDSAKLPEGGTLCRDATASGQDGASCTSNDDCSAGYTCLGQPGQCRQFCGGDDDCASGGHCLITITYSSGGGASQPVPGASTCTKSCAPHQATGNGCPASGFACRIYYADPDGTDSNGDEYFLTDCDPVSGGAGGDGASCTTAASCAAGMDCVTVNSVAQCKPSCQVGTSGGCPGGTTCSSFTDPITIGGVEYGVCL